LCSGGLRTGRGLDAEDIGAWLGLSAAAVEILCDDLEAAGLLTRVRISGEP
jgi:DNA-binding MarR family transcriptional regulator